MKREREKAQLKNKEPKEEFIVDLDRLRNKTAKSDRELSDSAESSENTFNEAERSTVEENPGRMRENENIASNAHREESADAKSEW